MFKQLLWKEWRENLWKLTFGGAVSVAFVMLLFRIRLFPDSANCVAISFVQMLALPVIYALDIFSGEMNNRTIHLLFKFPVPRWKMFFAKYVVSVGGMAMIILMSGLLMEIISQGRESDVGKLFNLNASFGIPALLLFTWFCAFGAQSRSEAGSLAAIFGVMVGWGIVYFWAFYCDVNWALPFVPYITTFAWPQGGLLEVFKSIQVVISQSLSVVLALCIGCYRFVKVRRCL